MNRSCEIIKHIRTRATNFSCCKMLTLRASRLPFSRVLTAVQHQPVCCVSVKAVNKRYQQQNNESKYGSRPATVACALAVCAGVAYTFYRKRGGQLFMQAHADTGQSNRTITVDELLKHNNEQSGVWVSYGNVVYDVTSFMAGHPGGKKNILLAAGGPLEPFWNALPIHKSPEVRDMLEEYRIGEVRDPAERAKLAELCKKGESLARAHEQYMYEPQRSEQLRVVNERPFNAETPASSQAHDFYTPNPLFFVRNHLGVPKIDMTNYKLVVEVDEQLSATLSKQRQSQSRTGNTIELGSLTYDALQKFTPHENVVALMCSGNRRSEMHEVEPVKGLMWQIGAASNARWTGALLAETLEHLTGYSLEQLAAAGVRHVQFVGADCDVAGSGSYSASVPLELVRSRRDAILLAYSMNGEPLPADHGFPVRVLVPGVTGARSVKWLTRIRLSTSEADSVWQRNDYRVLPGWMTFERNNLNFSVAPPIYDVPITSVICEPAAGAHVHVSATVTGVPADSKYTIPVRGFALSGGGHSIVRVEVSADGGLTWQTTTLTRSKSEAEYLPETPDYGWTQWHAELIVPQQSLGPDGKLELICRATDTSYNVQPENVRTIWNVRGLLNNAQHRRTIFVSS